MPQSAKSKDPNMPSQSLEHGEEIERQFKKAVVAGGPLKGARFLGRWMGRFEEGCP